MDWNAVSRVRLSGRTRISCILALAFCAPSHILAQTVPAATPDQQQEQRERAQRDAQQREELRQAPDVRLQPELATDFRHVELPKEAPCFRLDTLRLEGPHSEAFGFVQDYLDRYAGQCVGQQGLQLIVHRASDLILARGYVTTKLATPEQNLAQGTFRVVLIAGTVGKVRFADGSAKANWRSALPLRPGDLLNLRAIEQGLEQMKRVPSQDVKIDIAPGDQPGTSDLVLSVARGKPWRVTLNQDDSGSRATGREQGGVNLALDQPFGFNDMFVAGATHSVGRDRGVRGTHGANVNYSFPWDYWTFSASTNAYGYRQPVTGALQTFSFTGKSRTNTLSVTRLIQRDANSKTAVQFTLSGRQAHSYVDGTEIETQRRQTRAAELAVTHRRYLGAGQLDLRLGYRRNVPWFDGQWDRGGQGTPTFRARILTLDASFNLPFKAIGQQWLWTSELRAQATGDTVYAEDYLTIASRYTVRGFDGEYTIGGPHGYYWRNTLAWPLGGSGASLYGGVDVGRTGGAPTPGLDSHAVSGAVLGLRGERWGLSWDLFAGWALQRPDGLKTRRPAAGMQWIYSF
jgi:hemolysin activation/secretion protein